MKKRILFIFSVFVFFIIVFLIQKTIFTLMHAHLTGDVSVSELFQILYNGVSMDASTSGYLTAIPFILTIASLWVNSSIIRKILLPYFAIIAIILSAIYIIDLGIYPHWTTHIDSTIFLFLSTPKEALASASTQEIILGTISFLIMSMAIFMGARYLLLSQLKTIEPIQAKKTLKPTLALILIGGLIFVAIRGGVTASTMNIGRAFFSSKMFFNQAAVNPVFGLIYSSTKFDDFSSQYQFFEREKATSIFDQFTTKAIGAPIDTLLNTTRPNIIFIVLESFSAGVAYDSVIAPNFVRIAQEGINFTNFYANSFRTDRALVSIFSGYPAHPTAALMKYTEKTQSLPSIPRWLLNNGYSTKFYHGGDIDFANMRSYIVGTCGTTDIYEDEKFPIAHRLTKWGVPDEYVFDKLLEDIKSENYQEPFATTLLTLSSHEPFDVPTNTFEEPFPNSVHYTDAHLGKFIDGLKQTKCWDNTLVILLADHCMQSYPEGLDNYDKHRFHIPMVWTGGAIKKAIEIDEVSSQNHLAATLLAQLNIDYSDFKFSNDMFNSQEEHYAFYSYNNGFSLMDSTSVVIYDNNANKTLKKEGEDLEDKAKAIFQTMYIDLGER